MPLLFIFALQCDIRQTQENEGVLNGAGNISFRYSLVRFFFGVKTCVNRIKSNTEALLVASKEAGHRVNAEKTQIHTCPCLVNRLLGKVTS
jgi:hypothetical protein